MWLVRKRKSSKPGDVHVVKIRSRMRKHDSKQLSNHTGRTSVSPTESCHSAETIWHIFILLRCRMVFSTAQSHLNGKTWALLSVMELSNPYLILSNAIGLTKMLNNNANAVDIKHNDSPLARKLYGQISTVYAKINGFLLDRSTKYHNIKTDNRRL